MRIQQFQVSLVNKTKNQLSRPFRNFDARSFFTVVKLSYARPRIHYEVWVRGKEHLVELGLHFEADKSINDQLLTYFEQRSVLVHAELGPRIEIERWTNSWARVHEVIPYTHLDDELVDILAERLARMITVLQPMVEECAPVRRTRRSRA